MGKADRVKMLLAKGADPLIKNQYGLTALQAASTYGYGGFDDVEELLKQAEGK